MRNFAILVVVGLSLSAGCATRSKAVIGGMAVDFNKNDPATNLIVLIRTMIGPNPSAEDQAIISLTQIEGGPRSYTQVLCKNPDGNLELVLGPAMGSINDHFEYSPETYILDFGLGVLDAKKLPVSEQEIQLLEVSFVDVRRPRKVFEMSTRVLGQWYIISANVTKKGEAGRKSARVMSCATAYQTRED